jgi:hypothetical protein
MTIRPKRFGTLRFDHIPNAEKDDYHHRLKTLLANHRSNFRWKWVVDADYCFVDVDVFSEDAFMVLKLASPTVARTADKN